MSVVRISDLSSGISSVCVFTQVAVSSTMRVFLRKCVYTNLVSVYSSSGQFNYVSIVTKRCLYLFALLICSNVL